MFFQFWGISPNFALEMPYQHYFFMVKYSLYLYKRSGIKTGILTDVSNGFQWEYRTQIFHLHYNVQAAREKHRLINNPYLSEEADWIKF